MAHLTIDDAGVIVNCRRCAKPNRIRFERAGASARCGQCKAALDPPGVPIDVDTTARFDALVSRASLPILVDFWAPWCGPCRAVAPEFDTLARARAGRILVAKVNTDALPDLASRFGIRSIPTMALFREGREAQRTVGAMGADDMTRFVDAALAA